MQAHNALSRTSGAWGTCRNDHGWNGHHKVCNTSLQISYLATQRGEYDELNMTHTKVETEHPNNLTQRWLLLSRQPTGETRTGCCGTKQAWLCDAAQRRSQSSFTHVRFGSALLITYAGLQKIRFGPRMVQHCPVIC